MTTKITQEEATEIQKNFLRLREVTNMEILKIADIFAAEYDTTTEDILNALDKSIPEIKAEFDKHHQQNREETKAIVAALRESAAIHLS